MANVTFSEICMNIYTNSLSFKIFRFMYWGQFMVHAYGIYKVVYADIFNTIWGLYMTHDLGIQGYFSLFH
jgi:hypothetical protein